MSGRQLINHSGQYEDDEIMEARHQSFDSLPSGGLPVREIDQNVRVNGTLWEVQRLRQITSWRTWVFTHPQKFPIRPRIFSGLIHWAGFFVGFPGPSVPYPSPEKSLPLKRAHRERF